MGLSLKKSESSVLNHDISKRLYKFSPHAEQRRIVARVEQLMTLVDPLEKRFDAYCKKSQKLLRDVASELTLI